MLRAQFTLALSAAARAAEMSREPGMPDIPSPAAGRGGEIEAHESSSVGGAVGRRCLVPDCGRADCIVAGVVPDSCGAWGASVESVDGARLQDLFHCWRGASGARHVCKVVPRAQEAIIAHFGQALVIAAARDAEGVRALAVLSSSAFDSPPGRRERARVRAEGCTEWHLYLTDDPAKAGDLSDGLRAARCAEAHAALT